MLDLYTAIVFITVFTLVITIADVVTNQLVAKRNKSEVVFLCLMIGIAIFCEWIGVKTNGADVSLIWMHRSAKLVEFCISPAIGITAASAYGKVKHPEYTALFLIAHTAFEILGLFNNWVFSIDAENIYHREGLYWVYVASFVLAVVYCFVCIVNGGKKYQAKFGSVLILILCFLASGFIIQMAHSDIRVDFMCVAIGNLLLYNYRGNIVHQVDPLTHLLNRRCYEKMIENIKSPAVVLMFDVNKFKRINDTYGHAEGDRCLKLIARQINEIYGRYGSCYRIGGDEFCVIMYKNFNNPEHINRRFTDAVEQLGEKDARLSGVALGYAYYDEKKTDIQTAIKEADEMMYRNKH